jgi:hypothetical protein
MLDVSIEATRIIMIPNPFIVSNSYWSLSSHKFSCSSIVPIAPAQSVLADQIVKFTGAFGTEKSIYQGDPSPEVDKAWEDLYQSTY